MSGANKNCHVSTKWEDTGGKPDLECDASVLSSTTNEDSLQELIDKELALRSKSVAITNGVERPKSLLISDIDDTDRVLVAPAVSPEKKSGADSFDIFNSPIENGNGGCQRSNSFKLSRGIAITEVEDFDVLYNEVSSDEVLVNGGLHATNLAASSPSELCIASPKDFSESTLNGVQKLPDQTNVSVKSEPLTELLLVEVESSRRQLVSSSDETESSVDSVRVVCNGSTNHLDVDNDFEINFTTNSANNDFVPVSEVDIITDAHDIELLSNSSVADEQSTMSMSSIVDVQKINDDVELLEDGLMEDGVFITDTNAQKSYNQIEGENMMSGGDVVATDDPTSRRSAEEHHYLESNLLSVEKKYTSSEVVQNERGSSNSVPVECVEKSPPHDAEEEDDVFTVHYNGDTSDNTRDAMELEKITHDEYAKLCGSGISRTKNETFEKGFETWNTKAATIAASLTPVTVSEESKGLYNKCERQLIEECSYELTLSSDVVSETTVAEKKTVKKKKSANEESVTTSRTKKTKKTKKYEEKENISVHNELDQKDIDDPNFHQILDDGDELSNVCVRDLKIMYCNEASKTTSSGKVPQYEEPVPASVPIKELTRSFGDLRVVNGSESPVHINNNSRAGFGKFDQLSKKAVMHVRSSDPAKAQQQFSQNDASQDSGNLCKTCNKNVFAMEQIKAERHVWHKNCFRCKTCNKQLTVDVYSSHEGELFCKPHFRDLFKPKTVVEEEKPSSDKPDLGLEELSSLNVKSRFQVFEKPQVEETTDKSPISVKRSPSILSKLAKFQAKGMDVGVSSDIFNGIDYEESSSSEEEAAPDDNITRSTVVKEKPMAFNKMNDVKMNWENGHTAKKEERREQRREEMQHIRSRLFMGKQNKMREAYENAVAESERANVKKDVEVKSDKARTIKEKFEKGESIHYEESDEEQDKKSASKQDDMDVFEAGISKKSRSMFQQMDAAIKTQTQTQNNVTSPQPVVQNGHRSHRESESPEREVSKNPDVVRCDEQADDENEVLKKSNTTAKMLSLFRQMEEAQEVVPDGPRPLKKFTPPPQSNSTSEDESEEESEEQSEASNPPDEIVRASDKTEDEYLKMAQSAAKAKALKEKFEKWEPEKHLSNSAINLLDSEQANLDTTKSLRARFESLKAEQPVDKPRLKVNRFVDKSLPGYCDTCFKKVYPLEKVEAGDKVFHRSCFKCSRCNGILRMETFTMNNGHLYCVPHFKQLFITKGNYDEGFGNHQHKAKWPVHTGVPVTNGIH